MRAPVRVVVTGMGVVSPIGVGVEPFWQAALRGEVGTREVQLFDMSAYSTKLAGEVRDFTPPRGVERLPRATQFALVASREALSQADLIDACADRSRVGACFGTVLANRPSVESVVERWSRSTESQAGLESASDAGLLARTTAREFGLLGPTLVVATACAAGNSAITFGMDMIRSGCADAMLVGGADALSAAMLTMFNSFHALAQDLVRPFAKTRTGLLLSEGAGALVLESEAHALRRGASILAEVVGHGNFSDAHHMTAPHPDGWGAIRSMRAALDMSGLAPEQIDYISAHGTGTPLNDSVESKAIRHLFGAAATDIPVSSIKSMLGHTQGAASAIEAIACVLAMRDGVVPPNVNYDEPDPECDVDIVANAARARRVDAAMNNAFGFGGNISCVVLARHGMAKAVAA